MKTITTSLSFVLSLGLAMALPPASQIQISLNGHRPNSIIVFDGRTYSSAGNIVFIEHVTPGNHTLQVLRPTAWGHQGVLFSGNVRVPVASHVVATLGRHGLQVGSTPLAHEGPSYWDECEDLPGAIVHDPYDHYPQPSGPGFCGTPPVQGMRPEVFGQLVRTIEAQSFDSDQLRVAKQGIRLNGVTSAQMRELMELMSFESTKLDLAKFGYQFVADPGNYFVVNDAFWFSSSVSELDRFISNY
jgi:hypothetical protein